MPDLAIFDLDGTLHRTGAALTPAIRLALADVGARIPPDAEIEALYGEPIPLISEALLPNAGEAVHGDFVTALKTGQARTVPLSAESYEGVPEMLSTLSESGWMLAVCSNAGLDYIELVTRALGIRGLFGMFSGLLPGFDKADRIGRLAAESGGFTVVIGDRYLDFEAADAAGLPSIGCAWGYGAARELAAATVVARRPSEIPALLEALRRGREA